MTKLRAYRKNPKDKEAGTVFVVEPPDMPIEVASDDEEAMEETEAKE